MQLFSCTANIAIELAYPNERYVLTPLNVFVACVHIKSLGAIIIVVSILMMGGAGALIILLPKIMVTMLSNNLLCGIMHVYIY